MSVWSFFGAFWWEGQGADAQGQTQELDGVSVGRGLE